MSPVTTLILLGLVNWLVTTILVESEITRPIRDWVENQHTVGFDIFDPRYSWAKSIHEAKWQTRVWRKVGYLVHCHLCAGTWVGLVMAAVVSYRAFAVRPAFLAAVLTGLAIKAVGHLTLEVVGWLQKIR